MQYSTVHAICRAKRSGQNGVEMVLKRAENGLKRAEKHASFGLNGSHFCRKPLPRKARKIVATPGDSKARKPKELQPITTRSERQNDVKCLPLNELRRHQFLKFFAVAIILQSITGGRSRNWRGIGKRSWI
jgi:hypothetical protein